MDISGGFDRRNNEHIYQKFQDLDNKLTKKIDELEESHRLTRESLKIFQLQMNIVIFFSKIIATLLVTAIVGGWLVLLRM